MCVRERESVCECKCVGERECKCVGESLSVCGRESECV